jgi:hypothetical protein
MHRDRATARQSARLSSAPIYMHVCLFLCVFLCVFVHGELPLALLWTPTDIDVGCVCGRGVGLGRRRVT